MAFNCASTGIGISTFWFSTSTGTYHYRNWHSLLVPVLVLAFLHLGSVPVLAHTITGTGIQNDARTGVGIVAHWFIIGMGIVRYWYWHLILPVPVLAFLHLGSLPVQAQSITHIGIQKWCPYWYWHFCTWFSTSMGTFHYRNWDPNMVPVLVLAFLHLVSVPV
jgi:hypothetical protein